EERYQDAREMADALATTREGRAQERRASTVGVGPAPVARRGGWAAWSGWVVAGVLGALLGAQQLRGRSGARDATSAAAPAVAPDAVVAVASVPDAATPPPVMTDASGAAIADVPADAAAPSSDAALDAAAAVTHAWSAPLDDARARIAHGDRHGAMHVLASAARTSPDARTDPAMLDAALATLAAPDGDLLIPLLLRDFAGAPLIDALSA